MKSKTAYLYQLAISSVLLFTMFGCKQDLNAIKCDVLVEPYIGDTLVYLDDYGVLNYHDKNYAFVSEKYVTGLTEDSLNILIKIDVTETIDSNRWQSSSYSIKESISGNYYYDYSRLMLDERPIPYDSTHRPYIIHPVTGYYIAISDNVITRAQLSEAQLREISRVSNKMHSHRDVEFNRESRINFTVFVKDKEWFDGNCTDNIPDDVLRLLKVMRIIIE